VGFSSDVIPDKWRLLYSLNPLVGVIDLFRWAITGSTLYVPSLVISAVVIVLLLVIGIWYFRRTERTFADII
jgi:lipopolysaccharide transport system permease protein